MTYEEMNDQERRMERLRCAELLYKYDPESGCFYSRKSGNEAGFLSQGAILLSLPATKSKKATSVSGSQFAWYMLNGDDPNVDGAVVTHIDGDHENNKWWNLERCIGSQTRKSYRNNRSSDCIGVTMNQKTGKYIAQIRTEDGKQKYIGSFETTAEAKAARDEAISQWYSDNYPEFKRTINEEDLK